MRFLFPILTILALTLGHISIAAAFTPTPYTEESFNKKLKEGPVIVLFHKQGCGSCAGIIKNTGVVFEDPKFAKIAFLQVDAFSEPGLTLMKKYGVTTWSVLAFFKQGNSTPIDTNNPGGSPPEGLKKLYSQVF